MREPTVARDRERGTTGIIDTLSAGYVTVNRRPWILAVPVLLDLFFWLGPRLSLAPLVEKVFGQLPVPAGLPADVLQNYKDSLDGLLQVGRSFNLFSLLANHFPGIPSLMAGKEGLGSTVPLADSWTAITLFLLLPVAGIGLASIYYVWIGQQVRGSAGGFEGMAWRTWYRLLAFLLMALGVSVLLGIPLAVLVFLAGANMSVLGFVGALAWVAALWAQFYLFFVVEAMVISDAGPLQAVRNSVAVVRLNLGSTVGLVALIWVITLGMPIVWDAFAHNEIGAMVGMLGNAYVSTGLAVASMIFYRDRFARVREGLLPSPSGRGPG